MYKKYSDYLKEKYGEKVYKLPINIDATCPNRDGKISEGGCIFCAEEGAGHEASCNTISVKDQMESIKGKISKRYGAKKFIAYFQNYSNTYIEFEKFKKYMEDACIEDVVEISISTRPDCIEKKYLDFVYELGKEKEVEISFELGLQSVNDKTLEKINRGHTLSQFVEAVNMIKKYKFDITTHLILNLPWDSMEDIVDAAKIMSKLNITCVKLHSLYIVKGTEMARMYANGDFEMISKDEYVNRVITFLKYLNKKIVVQRLLSRVPEERSEFSNWGMSWWKIKEEIEEIMEKENINQGDKCTI